MTTDLPARARWWADQLVRRPSVTGSADEATFAPFLAGLLRGSPALRERADDVWLLDVPGGRHARACVLALVRGEGAATVVLTGHFDTVGTANYGALEPLAFDPEALLPVLIDSLGAGPGDADASTLAARRARDDLTSGEFVPGRGLLDMKAGLAAALAALERFAAEPVRRGNLLFLAVPDEENNSAGAHAAALALPRIAAERGLVLTAAINLDAIADNGDGEAGRAVALGTVGKLCPSALVIGRPVHACYSFDGIGALALAGALAAELEWCPGLTERSGSTGAVEQGAGPTLLGLRDDRSVYDVTMPGTCWMYWNVISHDADPNAVLDIVAGAAERSARELCDRLAARRADATGESAPLPPVRVVRYDALRDELHRIRPDAGLLIAARAAALAIDGFDLPEQCRRLTGYVAKLAGLEAPAIVLGFASMPYLPTRLRAGALEDAIRAETSRVAERHGTGIRIIERFPAICDVSALGQADASALPRIAAQTPAWGHGLPQLAVGGLPCINAGPWGRDYHTRLERMHRGYAETVLPDLVGSLARAIIAAATGMDAVTQEARPPQS